MHAFCLFMVLNSSPHAGELAPAFCTAAPMISTFQISVHGRYSITKVPVISLRVPESRHPSLTEPSPEENK